MRAVDPPDVWTDFSRYPHEELIRALSISNPHEIVAAGDAWAAVAAALFERAQDIADRSGALSSSWTGAAADRYRTMTTELLTGVRRIAATAQEARDLMYAAGEALHAAWTAMPAVSGEEARRQAVLIMARLAERYLAVTAELNETMSQLLPAGTDPALAGAGGAPSGSLPPGQLVFGNPSGPVAGGRPPLFGGMLPAGLAAAGLVLGRPFLPSLLTPRRGGPPPAAAVPPVPPASPVAGGAGPGGGGPALPEATLPTAAGAGPGLGGGPAPMAGPGPGGGGSALGGGGAALPSLPDPGATAAGGGAPAGQAPPGGIAAASGGGAGTGAGGMRGMPMIPMMPMGMGGAEGGGGRRIPQWLVETEDVWGEPAVVTSSVIGDEGAAGTWW
ncbi:hypothetical protein Asp14428_12960 [Actinoplanes sp. NBRC 14428]|nr:hypothetical protein Asp14428_12960 [Actinoplanes sp. NBRC 14428]